MVSSSTRLLLVLLLFSAGFVGAAPTAAACTIADRTDATDTCLDYNHIDGGGCDAGGYSVYHVLARTGADDIGHAEARYEEGCVAYHGYENHEWAEAETEACIDAAETCLVAEYHASEGGFFEPYCYTFVDVTSPAGNEDAYDDCPMGPLPGTGQPIF